MISQMTFALAKAKGERTLEGSFGPGDQGQGHKGVTVVEK